MNKETEARLHFDLKPSSRKPWFYENKYFVLKILIADDYWAYLDKSNNLVKNSVAISTITNMSGTSFYRFIAFRLMIELGFVK